LVFFTHQSRQCFARVVGVTGAIILSAGVIFPQSASVMDDQEAARILNVSPWVRIVSPTRSSDPFQFHETTVLWESSVVVRQALIKAYGPGSVQQYGEAYYVISVSFFPVASGAPPNSHANSAEELAEELLELCRASAHLTSGKVKRPALKVAPYLRGDQRILFFLFPRDPRIDPGEKEVTFEIHLPTLGGGVLDLKARFKPREMVYLGQPDL